MTQLIIDGKLADISADSRIDFTVENPYFTDSGEYTGEVTLTNRSSRNVHIYGNLGRLDKRRKKIALPCTLTTDNRPLIVGTATTTGFDSDDISVQLLGGNSHINFRSRYEKMYVDEMPELGMFEENWSTIFTPMESEQQRMAFAHKVMSGPDDSEYVMLPAQTPTGVNVNLWRRWSVMNVQPYVPQFSYPYSTHVGEYFPYPEEIAIQPRLCAVVRRVIQAIGFTIEEFDAAETPLKYIYYVNTKHTLYLHEMMPHWTVSEFLTEVQNFFGCVFVFDTRNMTCKIKQRSTFFSEEIVHIEKADEEFSAEVTDEYSDIGNANLMFATDEVNKIHLFDELANQNVEVVQCATIEEATTLLQNSPRYTVAELPDGRQYIWHHSYEETPRVEETNHLGCKFNADIEDTLNLRIVPAELTKTGAWSLVPGGPGGGTTLDGPFDTLVPVSTPAGQKSNFDIDEYAHMDKVPEENDLNIMRVAVFTSWDDLPDYGYTVHAWDYDPENPTGYADFPTTSKLWGGWTYYLDDITSLHYDTNHPFNPCLTLREIEGFDTLYRHGIGLAQTVDTATPHEITFYDDIDIFAINKTFVIRGHRYLCAKIDCSVDEYGVSKAKRGTFYCID